MPANYIAHIPLDNGEFEFEFALTSRGSPPSRDDPGSSPEFEIEAIRLFDVEFSDTVSLAIALTPLEVSYKETMGFFRFVSKEYKEAEIARFVARFESRLRNRVDLITKLDKLEDHAAVEATENYDE